MMHLWLSKTMGDGILPTGEIIWQKWNQFADLVGIAEEDWLDLNNEWLQCFKARNRLKEVQSHGEAVLANTHGVEDEQKWVHALIKRYSYKLCNIFNMDETGLLWVYASPACFYSLTHSTG